jgi:carbonic anhydrase
MTKSILWNGLAVGILACVLCSPVSYGKDVSPGGNPDRSLKVLTDGNARFAAQKMKHPGQSMERRAHVAKGQNPVAVVVSCSDSRVPPELLFDQGLGDLFVVRTAGEVVKDVEVGSIEYAVEHLNVPLVVVLGHKRCGAVEAAVEGGSAPGKIGSIVELIKPAVEQAKKLKGDVLDNSVRINVGLVADRIRDSEVITHFMKEKRLKIVKAYYDLDDGKVTILGEEK